MAQVTEKPDIAARGMGSWEYPFVSGRDVVPVHNNPWSRPETPYEANGGNNWSFAQKKTNPDIAERNMDGNVYPFASGMDVVPVQHNPWTRPDLPYAANGGSNQYSQSIDIANKEVRPDVYVTVHKLINPVAMGRFREPRPDEAPVERTWDDGPAPKEAPKREFKFKKPEPVDEDAVMDKAEKDKEDEESFQHDPEEKAEKPEEKAEKPEKEEKAEKPEEKSEKPKEEAEKAEKPEEKSE